MMMTSYGPTFDGYSEEDITLINKHMPFDQYEQYIKDHAGQHDQLYKTAHDKLNTHMQLLLDSIEQHSCILVTGAHCQISDGDTIEKATEFVAALRVLKNDVLPKVVECNDFVGTFLDGGKNSRAAHPATVLELMNHTLEQKTANGTSLST